MVAECTITRPAISACFRIAQRDAAAFELDGELALRLRGRRHHGHHVPQHRAASLGVELHVVGQRAGRHAKLGRLRGQAKLRLQGDRPLVAGDLHRIGPQSAAGEVHLEFAGAELEAVDVRPAELDGRVGFAPREIERPAVIERARTAAVKTSDVPL